MPVKYFAETELLKPPTERAAFSDRQAYVCAELSKLAYFKFEGGHTLDDALKIAEKIFGDDKRLKILQEQLKLLLTTSPSESRHSCHAATASWSYAPLCVRNCATSYNQAISASLSGSGQI